MRIHQMAVAILLLGAPVGALLVGTAAEPRPPQAAEQCVDPGAVYALGHQVYPGGHYCVPVP